MDKKTGKSSEDIRREITDRMIAAIGEGTMPWRQPWVNSPNAGPPTSIAGRRYSGINVLILMFASLESGFSSKFWGVSKAVLDAVGAHVKKGETARHITFYKTFPARNPDTKAIEKDENGRDKMVFLLREFPVFNIEQFQAPDVDKLLDGRGKFSLIKAMLGITDRSARKEVTTADELRQIARKYLPANNQPPASATREQIAKAIHDGIDAKLESYRVNGVEANTDPDFEPAEELLKASMAKIKHGGNKAFYRSAPHDYIQLPHKVSFNSMTDYYQTAFHELAHWTMPEDRVGRLKTFEDKEEAYAFEELVAEMSACFTMMSIGVPLAEEMLPRSQSYLASWVKKMENDPKYIFGASTQASKIVDYLLAFVGQENPPYEDDSQTSMREAA